MADTELIAVTGGAGFIGSHLVARLVEAGRSPRVIERPGANVAHLPTDRVEIVFADIRDRAAVRQAVRGVTHVCHLAADPNLWRQRRRDFLEVNHQGTVHVLEEALAAGARRVLHCSTESILTSRGFAGGAVEDLELHQRDMIGPYCMSKFLAEQAARRLANDGAPVVIVNPTLPVGPGDRGRSPPTRMTLACLRGELPAYLECSFNMIDARDVAAGIEAALWRGRFGRRYLLGGRNILLSEWLALAARAVGREPPRWRVPYAIALAAAYGSEWWADWVTGAMPQATVTGVKLTRRVMHFDPSASLKELGLAVRPLEESLMDAIAWFRDIGWLERA